MILGAQGISFAIPADTANWVVTQLLAHGRVRRGYPGIAAHTRPIDRWFAQLHDLTNTQAVEVMVIEPRGPAEGAGLRTGDLIVAINDQAIKSIDDLLAAWPP